jgi:hypothetical protein
MKNRLLDLLYTAALVVFFIVVLGASHYLEK